MDKKRKYYKASGASLNSQEIQGLQTVTFKTNFDIFKKDVSKDTPDNTVSNAAIADSSE